MESFGFAAAAMKGHDQSRFSAKAGGGDKIKRREKPWDGIPGGMVGRVLLAPYWYPKWQIKKRLRMRQVRRQRKLAAQEAENARRAAIEAEAEEKLKKIPEEEERLAREEEQKKERELEEARQKAIKHLTPDISDLTPGTWHLAPGTSHLAPDT